MASFWIGVAPLEHVRAAVTGGFCQLGHGRAKPVESLAPGDGIVYYSPREKLGSGQMVQSFVAIGRVGDGEAYEAQQGETFRPTRRKVVYADAALTLVRPLLEKLSFTARRGSWGMAFRRSVFEVSTEDFLKIAEAMGASKHFERDVVSGY